jgi:steroid delta-isomerase-like uncharacterized protein
MARGHDNGYCQFNMTSPTAPASLEIARSFFQAYNQHDANRMLQLCSDDAAIRYVPMEQQGEGSVREVGKKIWSGLIDAFPDLHVDAQSVFGDDRNVAAEVMIGGTQRKDFLDIPNQGKHYELPHAFILRFNSQKQIEQITAYWDNVSFYSQLGKQVLEKAA